MSGEMIAHWWRIGFCSIGGALIAFSIFYYMRGRARQGAAVRSWQRTTATIIGSSTRRMEQVQGMPGATWLIFRTGVSYYPQVEYVFDMNGPRHGNRAFLNGRQFYSLEQAETWLATVQPGSKVDTWFDPTNPDDSALVISSPLASAAIILFLLGAALVFTGIYLAKTFVS